MRPKRRPVTPSARDEPYDSTPPLVSPPETDWREYRFVNNFPTCAARAERTDALQDAPRPHSRPKRRVRLVPLPPPARSACLDALQKLLEVGLVLIGVGQRERRHGRIELVGRSQVRGHGHAVSRAGMGASENPRTQLAVNLQLIGWRGPSRLTSSNSTIAARNSHAGARARPGRGSSRAAPRSSSA